MVAKGAIATGECGSSSCSGWRDAFTDSHDRAIVSGFHSGRTCGHHGIHAFFSCSQYQRSHGDDCHAFSTVPFSNACSGSWG